MSKKSIILRVPESWESVLLGLDMKENTVQARIRALLQAVVPELEPDTTKRTPKEIADRQREEHERYLNVCRMSGFETVTEQIFTVGLKENY